MDKEKLESVLGKSFLERLEEKKSTLYLDLFLSMFQAQFQEINDFLMEKNLVLPVYELRRKFRYLIKKGPQKNEVHRELSTCIESRFNGIEIVKVVMSSEKRVMFKPLDIVYKPISAADQNFDCFIADSVRLFYRALIRRGKNSTESMTTEQCFACNKLFVENPHLQFCGNMPGIVYNFENQNISTFEDMSGS